MVSESEDSHSEDLEESVEKHEIKIHYHWYLSIFFVSYFISYLIPSIIFMAYFLLVFVPFFLGENDFFSIFLNLNSLLALILMPIVIIVCYLIRLVLLAMVTRFFWAITEKKSPTKDGIIPRNVPSKIINYYHMRSYMIKYPKYMFTKGIFPWLTNWLYNYVGTNKIGKNSTIEEQLCADKFIEVGDNCYIGVNSVLTSHLVEGIFGNVVYFKIRVGDNVTFAGRNNFASGCQIHDNAYLLPDACGGKHYIVKGDNYYWGLPIRKIFKKKICDYLKITEEDLKRAKDLEKQQKELINKTRTS
jgi:hypothetical protein